MAFVADSSINWEQWDYICGDPIKDMSIMTSRYYYLLHLSYKHDDLKIAFRDPITNSWTKWGPFPGLMLKAFYNGIYPRGCALQPAIDVHRSVLSNEIVIESDYPEYEQNYDASKLIGAILEHKGFTPCYYYSGNKSIHIHVFIDLSIFNDIDILLQEQIATRYKTQAGFKKAFMNWLRKLMITGWNTKIREFDEDLIRSSHLIRCELSKNKLGYKTFLGYTHKDLSFIPYICNETNRIYPRLSEQKLSRPHNPEKLVSEFLAEVTEVTRRLKAKRKESALTKWMDLPVEEGLRPCVKMILSDEFKQAKDGIKRGMFILVNELKRVYGLEKARLIIDDWNRSLGNPISNADIEYRMNQKNYSLSCAFIHKFLDGLNITISEKCKGKIYK